MKEPSRGILQRVLRRRDARTFLLGVVLLLGALACFCFCSRPVMVVGFSAAFNALFLGSRLFSSLAQEREKRTIDALRLTQLSSLDILRLKADRDLKFWGAGNGALLLAGSMSVLYSGQGATPLLFTGLALMVMAASGLFAISQALLISTFYTRSSRAILGGWLAKLCWLSFPFLGDQVVGALSMRDGGSVLFRLLDPTWLTLRFSKAYGSLLAAPPMGQFLVALVFLGFAAVVALGWACYRIDESFEQKGACPQSEAGSVYGRSFAGGLDGNPFFVRELAAQIRAGAGGWPGYAVFTLLFLGPYLYGSAQMNRQAAPAYPPLGDVRMVERVPVERDREAGQIERSLGVTASGSIFVPDQRNQHQKVLCLVWHSQVGEWQRLKRSASSSGSAANPYGPCRVGFVPPSAASAPEAVPGSSQVRDRHEARDYKQALSASLLLTMIYLFLRGVSFSAGSVAGEKDRRSWDQLVLTGASPKSFLWGKFVAQAYYPVRQLLAVSPILLLYVGLDAISLSALTLLLGLLLLTFLASIALGLACSAVWGKAYQAQGVALLLGLGFLLLPVLPIPNLGLVVVLYLFSGVALNRFHVFLGLFVLSVLGYGTSLASVSPIYPLLADWLPETMQWVMSFSSAGSLGRTDEAVSRLFASLLWVAFAGWVAYKRARTALEQGGGLRAS